MKARQGDHKRITRSIVDKIWNFFSSVKVGIGIIVAVLVTAAIGTIFPQKLYVPVTGQLQKQNTWLIMSDYMDFLVQFITNLVFMICIIVGGSSR